MPFDIATVPVTEPPVISSLPPVIDCSPFKIAPVIEIVPSDIVVLAPSRREPEATLTLPPLIVFVPPKAAVLFESPTLTVAPLLIVFSAPAVFVVLIFTVEPLLIVLLPAKVEPLLRVTVEPVISFSPCIVPFTVILEPLVIVLSPSNILVESIVSFTPSRSFVPAIVAVFVKATIAPVILLFPPKN